MILYLLLIIIIFHYDLSYQSHRIIACYNNNHQHNRPILLSPLPCILCSLIIIIINSFTQVLMVLMKMHNSSNEGTVLEMDFCLSFFFTLSPNRFFASLTCSAIVWLLLLPSLIPPHSIVRVMMIRCRSVLLQCGCKRRSSIYIRGMCTKLQITKELYTGTRQQMWNWFWIRGCSLTATTKAAAAAVVEAEQE